jgi:hypothetical protein
MCAREGVVQLALRPIVAVGRGRDLLQSSEDDGLQPNELLRLKLLAQILDSTTGPRVRADVASAGDIRAAAKKYYPFLTDGGKSSVVSNVNPLVIREDGTLLPYVYGISERYALGQLGTLDHVLPDSVQERLPAVANLISEAIVGLPSADDACVDWFDHVLRQSHRSVEPDL